MDLTRNHSELTFQAIVEATPNAIILVSKEGRIAYVNSQTEKLFGYSRTELISQVVETLIPERFHKNHPKFRDTFFSQPQTRAMGSGRELFARRKDGTEFPVEIGLNPLVTVDGILVLVSIIDISERKKAEERFRLVVESAPNAMILANHDGIITLINSQTERLFGYDRSELVGNTLEALIPGRYREKHPHLRTSFFNSPTVRSMGSGRDLFASRKDGTEFPVEIGLNPIETDEGIVVLASIIDITERKKHEASIQENMMLEVRNKELEQFNYIASHDLQEPLRTVSNYIKILEEDHMDQLSEDARAHLQTINRATTRMSTLVRLLLDYSKIGRDKKLTLVNSRTIVDHVITDLDSMIKSSRAKIEVEDLPNVHAYETELRQVFQNLIGNAIKFRKEEEDPVIKVGFQQNHDSVLFSISDNGSGIESRHFERIFQIFQQLGRQNEGHGIGLANCKKIVELHGGKIWVESEPGKGSVFKFTISNLVR